MIAVSRRIRAAQVSGMTLKGSGMVRLATPDAHARSSFDA
jgi:hypothetical protein